jgi:hypothetical protein
LLRCSRVHRFARRVSFIVCLMAGIAAPSAAHGQTPTGTMNLSLGVPAGFELDESSVKIVNTSTGFSGTVNNGGGPGPFQVTHLPVANGYSAEVTATPAGGGACSGINRDFPIFADTLTVAVVNLVCQRFPPSTGPNGNMNLHLSVPAGWTVEEGSVHIENTALGFSGTVNFTGGPGPFLVSHLPAADSYRAEVVASPVGGDAVGNCTGRNLDFPIFDGSSTLVFIQLNCQRPPGVPALGSHTPLLAAALALAGCLARRRRGPGCGGSSAPRESPSRSR